MMQPGMRAFDDPGIFANSVVVAASARRRHAQRHRRVELAGAVHRYCARDALRWMMETCQDRECAPRRAVPPPPAAATSRAFTPTG
ncbi:hypothetical protein [Burkholderia territorii]|uniref:hypothetical protein n=1 Tax=Burkholderia territorii TaxID=1503055 RepID=UPI0018C6A038|nr:hypothetical protein [Burkholderia territorii]